MVLIIQDTTCNKWSAKSFNCTIVYKLSYCNSLRILREVIFKINCIVTNHFPKYLNKEFVIIVLESVCDNIAIVRGATNDGIFGL
jgi:hypothetical protein